MKNMGRRACVALSTLFEEVSRDTWKLLKRGRGTGLPIPEETVTTLNLLKLSEMRLPGFSVRSFSKRLEGKNGADWEWWFGRRDGTWIGFRVQAKVLDLNSDRFEHLHYGPRRTGGTQAEQLVRSALNADPPRIPLYCLYSHWFKKQSYGSIQLPLNHSLHGCSIISPVVVHALKEEGRNHLHDLYPAMHPWHKLVSGASEHVPFAEAIRNLASRLLRRDEHPEDSSQEQGLVPMERALDRRVREANREFLKRVLAIQPTRWIPSYVLEGFRDERWGPSPGLSDPDPYLRGTTVISADS